MRFLARFLLSFAILFFLFTIHHLPFTRNALAAGEFETNYKVLYDVDEKGQTKVTQEITLTNKTSNFYADKFELKIGSTKVEDVKAKDTTGPLATEAKFENNVTVITVKFNQKVIGIGKNLSWNLTYSSGELAAKSGQIWEVSIPRLAKSADISQYLATVSTPSSFGPIAFAVPEPLTSEKKGSRQLFTFNRDQLVESGIAISFGQKQVFSFTLNYHLENNNLTSQVQEIALPPDNNYQKVVIEKLDPIPLDVVVDQDNNFLAKYRLSPRAQIDITAKGYIEVFSRPFRNIYPSLSPAEKGEYLKKQKYWETDNSLVMEKAGGLKTPKEIYDFVSTYLNYNEDRLTQAKIERQGAAAAAQRPQDAICTEFTDLFIAIARAAGIPAREVEGYAYTQNERLRPLSLALYPGDVLHAWPEFWDDNLGWVQVDPTWGFTSGGLDYFGKLDFNHITFVQRGISSLAPFPAGSYKKRGSQGKDIMIQFAQELPKITAAPRLSISAPQNIIAGIPVRIKANVANTGNTSIIGESVNLSSQTLRRILNIEKPQGQTDNSIEIAVLPPYAQKSYEFNLTSKSFSGNFQDILVLSYADTTVSAPVLIVPLYSLIFLKSFLASLTGALVIIITGLFFYKKHHKKGKRAKV